MGSDETMKNFKWYSVKELDEKFNGNERNQRRVNRKIANKKIKKVMGIKNGACR